MRACAHMRRIWWRFSGSQRPEPSLALSASAPALENAALLASALFSAVSATGAELRFGAVLNALISFMLIAAVIYFLVVVPVNRLMDRYKPEPKPAPTKECPECLSSIPETARRKLLWDNAVHCYRRFRSRAAAMAS